MLSAGEACSEKQFPAFEMVVGRNAGRKGTVACPFLRIGGTLRKRDSGLDAARESVARAEEDGAEGCCAGKQQIEPGCAAFGNAGNRQRANPDIRAVVFRSGTTDSSSC